MADDTNKSDEGVKAADPSTVTDQTANPSAAQAEAEVKLTPAQQRAIANVLRRQAEKAPPSDQQSLQKCNEQARASKLALREERNVMQDAAHRAIDSAFGSRVGRRMQKNLRPAAS